MWGWSIRHSENIFDKNTKIWFMYDFIFYFFYKYFEIKKDFSPRFSALCTVAGAQFIHAFFLVISLKYFFKISILPKVFSQVYAINKLYWTPVLGIWLLLIYTYYNHERVNCILNKRALEKKIVSFKNAIIIILILGVPLFSGIIILKYKWFSIFFCLFVVSGLRA